MIKALVSILVGTYSSERLEQIFEEIFSSSICECIEVVYVDDAIETSTWKIACHYQKLYPSKITVSRNRVPLGSEKNTSNLLRMATCNVYTLIADYSDVDIWLLIQEIKDLRETGYRKGFQTLHLKNGFGTLRQPYPSLSNKTLLSPNPIVWITVHNYNYGRFLRQCLDSLVNQTYKNIRISFSDNASEDDSWEIANEFMERYPGKFGITRNRINMGSKINIQNCEFHLEGDYYLQLCSDDRLALDCIEKCLYAFQGNPDAAMLIFHRDIEDTQGRIFKEPPFFNCSFKASATSIADVYLMSSINPSISQIMYSLKVAMPKLDSTLIDRWFSNRFRDFILSIEHPVIYINEALLINRIHGANDNLDIARNLIEVLGPYIANIEFELIAKERNQNLQNAGKWHRKLASLALRYSYRSLINGDLVLARRYYYLSMAITQETDDSDANILIERAINGTHVEREAALEALSELPSFRTRSVSYDPPLNASTL